MRLCRFFLALQPTPVGCLWPVVVPSPHRSPRPMPLQPTPYHTQTSHSQVAAGAAALDHPPRALQRLDHIHPLVVLCELAGGGAQRALDGFAQDCHLQVRGARGSERVKTRRLFVWWVVMASLIAVARRVGLLCAMLLWRSSGAPKQSAACGSSLLIAASSGKHTSSASASPSLVSRLE